MEKLKPLGPGVKVGLSMVLLAMVGLGFVGCGLGSGPHGNRQVSMGSNSDTSVRSRRDPERGQRRRHRRRMQKKRGARSGPRTDSESGEEIAVPEDDRDVEEEAAESDEAEDDTDEESEDRIARGEKTYDKYCSSCHGEDREGSLLAYPSLKNVSDRLTRDEIRAVIKSGPGSMPSFDQLSEEEVDALLEFLHEK